jgi:hypothetical protein
MFDCPICWEKWCDCDTSEWFKERLEPLPEKQFAQKVHFDRYKRKLEATDKPGGVGWFRKQHLLREKQEQVDAKNKV